MLYLYLLNFCQFFIGLAFTISLLGKLRDFSHFVAAIRNFRLLPQPLAPASAVAVCTGEFLVMLLLFTWPLAGLLFATVLLLLFSLALAAVLQRRIQTPCHCFGGGQQSV